MAFSYLSLRVVERDETSRKWNMLLQELQRRTITVTSPLLLSDGQSGGINLSILRTHAVGIENPPFFVYRSSALKVKVTGGRITWHDKDIDVADSSAITIPASASNYRIWLQLSDEFSSGTPSATFENSAAGWSGFPDQPAPPARKHFLLAEVDSNTTDITTIDLKWHGGDIIWPTIFGFWL